MKLFNKLKQEWKKQIEKWEKEGENRPERMKMDNIKYIKICLIIELILGCILLKYGDKIISILTAPFQLLY